MYDQKRPDVAVFIDFENIYVSVRDKLNATPNFEAIIDRCNDLGRVVISRAYADWYRYPRITSALYANAIEPIYVATYYYDKDAGRTGRAIKNSVDMNLCIDAMKTLFLNPNVTRFVLVTGDRDFIPLVHSIRQQGKEVYIIGIGGAASTHLAQSADEFVFYEQLVGRQPNASAAATAIANRATELNRALEAIEAPVAPPVIASVAPVTSGLPVTPVASTPPPTPPEPDIYEVLVQAIHLARKRGYVTTLGSLKMLMKELMGGDFKESRYRDLNGRPYTKFKDLVMDAEQRGKVQIFTKGSVNEVFLPGEDPLKLSRFAPILNEELSPEPVVLDPPIGNNGSVQIAEISPIVVEDVKEIPVDPPVLPAATSSRRRRRRSRRSNRNREEPVLVNDLLEEGNDIDEAVEGEPDYSPPQLDELSITQNVPVESLASDTDSMLPVTIADETPPVSSNSKEVAPSEPSPKSSRSQRRRSRKTTTEVASVPVINAELVANEPAVIEPDASAAPVDTAIMSTADVPVEPVGTTPAATADVPVEPVGTTPAATADVPVEPVGTTPAATADVPVEP
ncbi:MAG: NYN domain-containing protein, partial [Chloroflexus sp.]